MPTLTLSMLICSQDPAKAEAKAKAKADKEAAKAAAAAETKNTAKLVLIGIDFFCVTAGYSPSRQVLVSLASPPSSSR